MGTTLAGQRAPRNHIDRLAMVDVSGGLREFREVTEGLGTKLPFPGLNDMRADKRVCVHALVTRFLAAARMAFLPRAWAERFVVFVVSEVDRIWGTEIIDLVTARRLAVAAECQENVAEMDAGAPHASEADELSDLLKEASAVKAEIAADKVRLTAVNKRIEQLRRKGVLVLA